MPVSPKEEAAWTIVMLSHSLPGSTLRSVVAAKEREERVFIKIPREKRSLRTPIFRYSSFSTAIVVYVPEEDHIHDGPLTESTNKRPANLFSSPMEQRTKKKVKRKDTGASSSFGTREPAPEWLVQLMRSKNVVEEPKYIIEKTLTSTDVSSGHGRVSIPVNKIVDLEFLTPEENSVIQEQFDKLRKTGVDAKLVYSDLREFDVNLRRWGMGSTSLYNLLTGWNKVVKDCDLGKAQGRTIRLWSFHSNGQLYFALDLLPAPVTVSSALVIYDGQV